MSDSNSDQDEQHSAEQRGHESQDAGHDGPVEDLLAEHLGALRSFVRLRATPEIRAQESASDIVQSVCREVLTHADRFQYPSPSAFRSWLFTTARRKILNRLEFHRAQKRDVRRNVDIEQGDAELLQNYSQFASPSQQVMLREDMERVERAFDQLPEDYRDVILLAHVVGLSRSEIAAKMERQEGAVRVLLHRAMARLATVLEDS